MREIVTHFVQISRSVEISEKISKRKSEREVMSEFDFDLDEQNSLFGGGGDGGGGDGGGVNVDFLRQSTDLLLSTYVDTRDDEDNTEQWQLLLQHNSRNMASTANDNNLFNTNTSTNSTNNNYNNNNNNNNEFDDDNDDDVENNNNNNDDDDVDDFDAADEKRNRKALKRPIERSIEFGDNDALRDSTADLSRQLAGINPQSMIAPDRANLVPQQRTPAVALPTRSVAMPTVLPNTGFFVCNFDFLKRNS